jgi:prophage maintenance system killer protein
MSKIEIYTNKNNETSIEVNFDDETVWLNQSQMTELFQRDRTVITKHINNIFKEEELDRKSNVQKMHIANSDKPVEFYNLDVIISVGYRVKSKQGTQFRQWATSRLKNYLIQGYAVNQKRLDQLQKTIELIANNQETNNLDEAKGLLEIIKNYNKSFILLNQFDSNSLKTEKLNENITYEIKFEEALKAIEELKSQLMKKKEATELFGNRKDGGFEGILGNIVQSFGGQYLYKSIEEQAANLLYFVIKNHSFSDGNKRIGAFMFIWFLEKNKHALKTNGELKINDNALTALALLIANSSPSEKDLMVSLVINLIKDQ